MEQILKLIISLFQYHTTASKNSSKKAPSLSSPTVDNSPKLKEEDGFYIWQKGEVHKLSDHFSTKEMDCQCNHESCKEQRISKELIQRLENIRIDVNQPLVVTSAFRCQKHQEDIRNSGVSTVVAKKQSQHELGNAVDVRPKDRQGIRGPFLLICEYYFTTIGLSDKFLHLDMRKDKIRWEY